MHVFYICMHNSGIYMIIILPVVDRHASAVLTWRLDMISLLVASALLVSTLAKQGANRVPRDDHSNCRASVEKSIRRLQTIVIIYHKDQRIYERKFR